MSIYIEGFKLAMIDGECWISKGAFGASLNFAAQKGELPNFDWEKTIAVPDHVIQFAEEWEASK